MQSLNKRKVKGINSVKPLMIASFSKSQANSQSRLKTFVNSNLTNFVKKRAKRQRIKSRYCARWQTLTTNNYRRIWAVKKANQAAKLLASMEALSVNKHTILMMHESAMPLSRNKRQYQAKGPYGQGKSIEVSLLNVHP